MSVAAPPANFSEAKKQYKNGNITIQDLASVVVDRIKIGIVIAERINEDLGTDLKLDILPLFEEIVEHNDLTVDDFDNALEVLYDWADTSLDDAFAGKKNLIFLWQFF